MPDERPTLDLGALVQDFVEDLRVTARPAPDRGDEPADRGRERLRRAAEEVRDGQAAAAAEVNARYRERATALRDVLVQRQQRLEAYAGRQRGTVPTDPELFVVAGRVTDEATGSGLPRVRVRAIDLDRRRDDLLGEVRTDALGYYRLEYRAADFRERDENPETYIQVLDEEGEVLFTSTRSFVQKAGKSAFIPAAVDGARVPASRRMAGKVDDAVAARRRDFQRRRRVLEPETDVGLDATLTASREASGSLRSTVVVAGGRSLTDVRGIGPTYRERLEREGVRSAEEVARMEPGRLAGILGVGEGRAAGIIEEARKG